MGGYTAIHVTGTFWAKNTVAGTFVHTAQDLGLVCYNPRIQRILPPQECNWTF